MIVKELTGFESYAPVIAIFDDRGNAFYYFENDDEERITFNLIPGNYDLRCEISPLRRPLTYVLPKLPKAERYLKVPENFDFEFYPNRNKASVDLQNGFGIVDTDYEHGDTPQLIFLKSHEIGHYIYKTEWKCDVYAALSMIERGFNPTQCYYAEACCLSDNGKVRKNILLAWLKKIKCYE